MKEEGAIHFASQLLPENWRHLWRLRGCELLQLLQRHRHSSTNDDNALSISHSLSLSMDSQFVAVMPEASLLKDVLGWVSASGNERQATSEFRKRTNRFTSAVRLHFAAVHGGDFKLEVFVNAMTGSAMAQANGDDDLVRDMLGDYLADAMEGSLCNQEKGRIGTAGTTKALGVIPVETTDCRLLVLLRFSTGKELFNHLFPV